MSDSLDPEPVAGDAVDFEAELRRRTAAVDDALFDLPVDGTPPGLYDASRHLIEAGGKRVRPALVLLVTEALGGDDDYADRMPAALAVELVHTLSLIHDDVMDDDDLRRGVPSVHAAWDPGTAIVAGDLLYAMAFDLVFEADAPLGDRAACCRVLARTCRRLCEGQALDLSMTGGRVSEGRYLTAAERKTGALFAGAAEIGAILGGADAEVREELSAYGRTLGVAFQLHDDVLDVEGSTGTIGKPAGSDLEGDKTTLVTIHARRNGVDAVGELDEPIAALEAAGSVDYARRAAERSARAATAHLEVLPAGVPRDTLAWLADHAVRRER